MSRARRGTKIAVAVAVVAVVLAGCDAATIGAACTGGVGHDDVNVLFCKDGHWTKLMTIDEYAAALGGHPPASGPAQVVTPPVTPGGNPDPTTTTVAPTTTTSTTTTSTTTTSTTTSTTTTTAPPTGFTGLFPNTPIQGWRVNGQGFANVVVGNTVYVGGEFSTATSYDGSQSVARANVAAFDLDTGALRPGFVANTDGGVRDLAVSGSTLYIAGSFSSVNGVGRSNLAAVDLATGAVTSWNPRPNQMVTKMAIGGGKMFLSGNFNYIGGSFRNHAGAVSLASGAVDSRFAPNINSGTNAIASNSAGTRIYIGGHYDSIDGNLPANIDFAPGTVQPDNDGSMDALDADGNQLGIHYASWRGTPLDIRVEGNDLYIATTANRVGRWDANTGRRTQVVYCGGDGQAVAHLGNYTYGGFHESCTDQAGNDDFTLRLVRMRSNGQRDYSFAPSFDQFWGVRDIGGDSATMVISGLFNYVSGVRASGFAIFKAVG